MQIQTYTSTHTHLEQPLIFNEACLDLSSKETNHGLFDFFRQIDASLTIESQ